MLLPPAAARRPPPSPPSEQMAKVDKIATQGGDSCSNETKWLPKSKTIMWCVFLRFTQLKKIFSFASLMLFLDGRNVFPCGVINWIYSKINNKE